MSTTRHNVMILFTCLSSILFLSCGGSNETQNAESGVTMEKTALISNTDDKTDKSIQTGDKNNKGNKSIVSAQENNKEDDTNGEKPLFDITTRKDGPPIDNKNAYIKWMLENTGHKEPYLTQRWERTEAAKKNYNPPDLTKDRVIQAFLRTPREYFCRSWNLDRAYIHNYMSIGYGVTISGPHIVARMTDLLNPEPDDKVLEIGTGSGYQSAFLAELSNFVYTIEIIEPLAKETDNIYKELEEDYPQYKNVRRKIADGYYGWEEEAPFDKIIVTCGIDHVPPSLLKQLSIGGVMIIPVGPPGAQELLYITKTEDEEGFVMIDRWSVYANVTGRAGGKTTVSFVPFTSEGGEGQHSKWTDGVSEEIPF